MRHIDHILVSPVFFPYIVFQDVQYWPRSAVSRFVVRRKRQSTPLKLTVLVQVSKNGVNDFRTQLTYHDHVQFSQMDSRRISINKIAHSIRRNDEGTILCPHAISNMKEWVHSNIILVKRTGALAICLF